MSFLSKLQIDGQEYNVLEFNINFNQELNKSGKPSGQAKGGEIDIIIEASQETNFLAWMLNSELAKDGKIIFYRRDALSKMKELNFVKAYCINYREQFTSTTEVPMKITMKLLTKELTFGGAKFHSDWIALE
jgi:hypothetical protein